MFEPAWEVQQFDPGVRSYIIIYPELITDFEEFRAGFENHPAVSLFSVGAEEPQGGAGYPASGSEAAGGATRAHGAPANEVRAGGGAGPVLREYETSPAEIRDVCAHIEKLLDEGVEPDDIAVSVCGEDAFAGYLEDACRRRDIPVTPRAGKALSAYPAGRFFENLRALPQNGFSLTAMQALLLDSSVPWREPAGLRSLVAAGVAGGCLRNYREDGRERDVWLAGLTGERREAERTLYQKLRLHATAVSAARGFRELRTALYEFFAAFLDTNAWSSSQMPVFQRCMEVLADLVDTAERLGLEEAKPFDLWLSVLRSRVYVPRGEAGGGVALYPYRVAAGMEPNYHFVVNASNDRMRLLYAPFRFLRDDEKASLGLADRDFTDAYAAVYARSGHHVLVSYARESFSGPQLPPSWFAERDLVELVDSDEAAADPFGLERSYFGGGSGPPHRLYSPQLQGAVRMAETAFRPRRPDWSQTAVSDAALRERLIGTRRSEEGLLKLSPSDVQAYRGCPFSYLLGRILELDPQAYELFAREAQDAGRAYHRGFETLFERIRRHSQVFRADEVDLYHSWVDEVAREAMESWPRGQTSLSPAETVPLRLKLRESLHEMIRADADVFDGYEIEVLERYESVNLQEGVRLGGYMDRRMRRPGTDEAVVIDYKKGELPKKKSFRVGANGDDEVEQLQLPLYAEILGEIGRTVTGLRLYSIEKQTYLIVYAGDDDSTEGDTGHAVLDEDGLAQARRAAREALEASAAGIRAGDFRFPNSREGCESCSFPGICRAKFMTG